MLSNMRHLGWFLFSSHKYASFGKSYANLIVSTYEILVNKSNLWPLWKPFVHQNKCLHTSLTNYCEEEEGVIEIENQVEEKKKIDPSLDRSRIIPVETSIKYLQSQAYKTTYGKDPVWLHYRRNFKGFKPPIKTRPTCIKDGRLISGNPCPICRDEYLVVDFLNVALIKQFVSQYTGHTLPYSKTNICQLQQTKIEVAIEKAKRYGKLPFYVPFREYNYEEYYKPDSK